MTSHSPVGSVDDYMREQHSELVQEVPEIGLEVSGSKYRREAGARLNSLLLENNSLFG
jgi:hypothetical protein